MTKKILEKTKKPTRQKRMAKLKKEADRLWSIKVRERDGFMCRITGCGKSPAFAHHIFSRRHLATRWDLRNGFTICWGHHKKGHTDHEWLRDEIIARIGTDDFDKLKYKSMLTVPDLLEEDLVSLIGTLK